MIGRRDPKIWWVTRATCYNTNEGEPGEINALADKTAPVPMVDQRDYDALKAENAALEVKLERD